MLRLAGPRQGRWNKGVRIEAVFRLRSEEPQKLRSKTADTAAGVSFASSGHVRFHRVKERGIVSFRDVTAVPQS